MALIQQMDHRVCLLLVIAVLLLTLPMYVAAEIPKAEEIFERLLQSSGTVDFEGRLTLVIQAPGGNPVSEAQVVRKAPDKQRIEFVWPPEISGTGMVINGEERWAIHSDREHRNRPFLAPPPNRMMDDFPLKNIQRLLRNYDIRVLDGGSIADRSTYLLEIEPKVDGKPSRKIWVDTETNIILKVENYGYQRRLMGFYAYSRINYKPEIDETVFQRQNRPPDEEGTQRIERGREELWNDSQGKPDLDKIRKAAQLNIVVPDQLPAGFALQSIQVLRFGERRNVHLGYTDGLAVVSVFQSLSEDGGRGGRRGGRGEGRPPGPDRTQRSGRPSESDRSQRPERPSGPDINVEKVTVNGVEFEVMTAGPTIILRWSFNTVFFTLMGEVDQKQMIEIAGSFINRSDS